MTTIEDLNEFGDIVDLLSPNEVLNNIQEYDLVVDIIGYVDERVEPAEDIQSIADGQKFVEFVLHNGNGKKVHIKAWNYDIEKIPCIKENDIIHLNGLQAKNEGDNNGDIPYILYIRQHTDISILGTLHYKPKLDENICGQNVILKGFIKTNFAEIHLKDKGKFQGYGSITKEEFQGYGSITKEKFQGCGSITNGKFKIQICINYFSNENYRARNIQKGDKIEVTGKMYTGGNTYTGVPIYPPRLFIDDISDIKKLEGHMSSELLLQGTCILKKENIYKRLTRF